MSEKLMLIVPMDLVDKINANRGDLGQAEFISFLIDSLLGKKTDEKQDVNKDEIEAKTGLDFLHGLADQKEDAIESGIAGMW